MMKRSKNVEGGFGMSESIAFPLAISTGLEMAGLSPISL